MALFGIGKKKEAENDNACRCVDTPASAAASPSGANGVKVLGSGCANCNALESAVREAMIELGMEPKIDHVTDFAEIAAYGVMRTPALVVDGRVLSFGKVLKRDEAVELLRKARG